MKRIRNLVLAILVIGTVVIGCKKNEEGNEPTPVLKNQFTFKDKNYKLDKGWLDEYGKNLVGTYSISLALTYGLVLGENDGEIDSVYGNGQFVYFDMYSSDSVMLEGVYTYDKEETLKAGTFDMGAVAINYDWANETGDEYYMNKGTVTIKKIENQYEVKVDGKTENGSLLTAYFKGNFNKLYLE